MLRVRIVEDCRDKKGLADGKLGKVVGYVEYGPELLHLNTPKIVLDDGDIIFGCECWWEEYSEKTAASLEESRKNLQNYKDQILQSCKEAFDLDDE